MLAFLSARCSLGGGQHFQQEKSMKSVEVYGKRAFALFVSTFLLVVILMTAQSSLAQTAGTGTISGTITDPSSAAIATATVEVRNTDTGIVRSVQTDDSGLYYAPFLQPGHYQVSATKEGFGRVEQKDI